MMRTNRKNRQEMFIHIDLYTNRKEETLFDATIQLYKMGNEFQHIESNIKQ